VGRSVEYRAGRTTLDHLAAPHHDRLVADLTDDGEVVRDEDVGHPGCVPDVGKQVENLCLHRYVQRGHCLIEDEDLWFGRERARYCQSLSLPSADRGDVLTSQPTSSGETVDIAGRTTATLAVTTSGPSMHLFATLQDVSPEGTTRPVSHGRIPLAAPDLASPVRLDLDDVAYRFQSGHRIQLQIKSGDFPWFLVHPGTDENPWFAKTFAVNDQTLFTGGVSASRVTLPRVTEGGPAVRRVEARRPGCCAFTSACQRSQFRRVPRWARKPLTCNFVWRARRRPKVNLAERYSKPSSTCRQLSDAICKNGWRGCVNAVRAFR
jgi:hypothetical protein